MVDVGKWDWEPGERVVADVGAWKDRFEWVEELEASPDGEKVAAVVNLGEAQFSVCVNGEPWEGEYDRVWNLRFGPDGRLAGLVSEMAEWTMCVDGEAWENRFAYAWGTQFSEDGSVIACAVQQDGEYGWCVDGEPWETLYEAAADFTLSRDGKVGAAAVQVVSMGQADIFTFQQGGYTCAVNGRAWADKFVNIFHIAISPDGSKVAAEARTSLYDYTIVVDGKPWAASYPCVWKPAIRPGDNAVVAPVRAAGKWTMATGQGVIWPSFAQCWHAMYSPDGARLAAIVAPGFGAWTMAVDGAPWKTTFQSCVTDAVFSPDGSRLACLGKNGSVWKVVVQDQAWPGNYDMAWRPVFSPGGDHAAAKVERAGRYTVAVDGAELPGDGFERCWSPAFSPDGASVLVRGVAGGKAVRRVVPVSDFKGRG